MKVFIKLDYVFRPSQSKKLKVKSKKYKIEENIYKFRIPWFFAFHFSLFTWISVARILSNSISNGKDSSASIKLNN
jgi:hypothetical protein